MFKAAAKESLKHAKKWETDMTRIAILGWGSLLWNPGTLHNERKSRSDGPWPPIEFARASNLKEKNNKRPYLSLVIYEHAGLVRTYWDMSLLT